MGALTVDSWRRLEDLIASHGDEDVLHMICEQVVLTGDLAIVGQTEGILTRVLWKWLKDPRHPERMEEYKDALEFKGEQCVHEALRIVDSATPENANVKKLQSDFRKWAASKWSKDRYGDGNGMGGGGFGGVTIVIGSVDAGRVLDGECGTEAGLVEVAAEGVRVEGPVQGDLRGSEGREDALHAGRDAA